ncbi:G5 domain-containing protein [Streptococcus sp. 596553]|uniref:G5 domain-containing protein n=1 Tax=Streptococcus sp. 596553 TaxID=2250596 RepID=UPI000DDBB805|nr:G5 domain-containing protein [Streptococcus sp. 596553]
MSRQSTKNKKYALRKIGKVFGSCVVATVITLGGVAIMAPNVTVYASNNESDPGPGETNIADFASNEDGYEVRVPKGKKYVGNDKIESTEPVLKHKGHDGRSFILKAKETDNLSKSEIDDYFSEEGNELENLFTKLYDEDEDRQTDEKYKRADADAINANAGNPIDGTNFVEPKVSDVDTRYPHRVDAGVTNIADIYDSNNDGKPDNADGVIDGQDTIVEANKPIEVNPEADENVVKEDGSVVLSKYYRIHVNKGDTADKDDDIYEVGTKPTVTTNEIDFKTIYEPNDQDVAGNQTIKTPGKKGTSTTTTTYTVNPETGARTANPSTTVETEKPVNKVVKVGNKQVTTQEIPMTVTYKEDPTLEGGKTVVDVEGAPGEKEITTVYDVSETDGSLSNPQTTEKTTTAMTPRVVRVGTKPKEVETPIPFPTRYERDDSVPNGQEVETVKGVDGKTVKKTTYTMNPDTGVVTQNEPTTEITDPVTRVVKVGTQPKVDVTPVPSPKRYEKDPDKEKGQPNQEVPGKPGTSTTTTTYEVDPKTGKVTEKVGDPVVVEPTETVVKVPAKDKVVTEEIPVVTEYEDDPTLEPGKEKEVTPGQPGEKTTTTTYTVDGKTGDITEKTTTQTTKEMVKRMVKRGPKEGTPSQPEQPTAPEEAPAQPGQPSDPEDQPNLKVAPPTIAIVEEANKASIEVKAPKKDADTVKITYPKSDGSGEEVLTLTKQPSGEWTLDKQPENVTLDKKTGTVTIPRESVVNKEKVQAQAKHKTSGYTPFVYAALSIEEANPEHPVTLWVDTAGKEIKERVEGQKVQAGEIAGYKWLSSRLEEGVLTHTFEKVANGTPSSPESSTSHPRTPSSSPSTSTPEKPNKAETPAVRTVWRDENGKDLKVPSVDKQEAGEVPGYEFVESHREGDNLTVHVFRTKQAQTPAPKDQTPNPEQAASPAPSKVSEQRGEAVATATSEKTVDSATSTKTSDKAELPNTGTEANASLASAGIMTLLAGLGLGFFKKKED